MNECTKEKIASGSVHPEASISQMGVGRLEVACMAWEYLGQIRFSYDITIYDSNGGPTWGTKVFEGTLEDLIKIVKEVKNESS